MSDSRQLVSGGGEGQVRVWEISEKGQVMKEALKEHKGTVTCIKIRRDDSEVKRVLAWVEPLLINYVHCTVCHGKH